MSDQTAAEQMEDADGLIRLICWIGFLGLPVLTFFVHLLVIYRT